MALIGLHKIKNIELPPEPIAVRTEHIMYIEPDSYMTPEGQPKACTKITFIGCNERYVFETFDEVLAKLKGTEIRSEQPFRFVPL